MGKYVLVGFEDFEFMVCCQFPETHRAEEERFLVRLPDVVGSVHDALVLAAVCETKHMANFVACVLQESVHY
jgi:predicted HicB family RNase H-like nuclease